MKTSVFRRSVAWTAVLYIGSVAAVLWPSIHEGFGWRIAVWDCLVPTIGFFMVIAGSAKAERTHLATIVFFAVASLTIFAFVAVWAFSSLDMDPHSLTTMLVFVYLPIVSTILAGAAYLIARFNLARRVA